MDLEVLEVTMDAPGIEPSANNTPVEAAQNEHKEQEDMMRFIGHIHGVTDTDIDQLEEYEDDGQEWWRWWTMTEAVKWSGEWNDEEPEKLGHMLPGVSPQLITEAMIKELDKFKELGVFEMIPRSEMEEYPNHILVGTRWVLVNKGSELEPKVKARLVAQEFANEKRDDLFAGTPGLTTIRTLVSRLATDNAYHSTTQANQKTEENTRGKSNDGLG